MGQGWAINSGGSFGAPTELEINLVRMVVEVVPSVEMVRMVSFGTEATMSAIRLARRFTVKDKIVKFSGCYHSHADSFLVKARFGAAIFGVPDSPGVPGDFVRLTLIAEYNSLESLRALVMANKGDLAYIIANGKLQAWVLTFARFID